MHYGIISSICFFHAVFYSPSTTVDAVRESLIRRNGNLTIQSNIWNHMIMVWNLDRKFTVTPNSLRVFYRPRLHQVALASLEWEKKEGFYVAKSAVEQFGTTDGWQSENETAFSTRNASNEIGISVTNLKFYDTDYVFEVRRTGVSESGHKITEYARTVVRTKPSVRTQPPKTGTGSFHVYSVGGCGRIVQIYWQGLDKSEYQVAVYEEDDKWRLVETRSGVLQDGSMWSIISLKAHYFVLNSHNDAGLSTSSFVYVPDQTDVWSPLKSVASLNTKECSYWYTLTWEKPDYANDVTNYTVFWFDPLYGLSSDGFYDFIHLSSDQTSVDVRADGYMALGLSANGKISSSGVQIVEVN